MHSANRKESRNQTLPLRPLVQVFLDKLAEVQWTKLESSWLDMTMEDVVKQCSFNAIRAMNRYETSIQSQSEESDLSFMQSPSTSVSAPTKNLNAYNKETHKHLSESISLTFAEVKDVLEYVHCRSPEEVTEHVMREITRWITTELYNSFKNHQTSIEESETLISKSSTYFQKFLVHRMVKKFKNCAIRMALRQMCNEKNDLEREAHEALQDSELVENAETSQIPVTPQQEDTPENLNPEGNSTHKTVVAIRSILDEVLNGITDIDTNFDITTDDYDQLMFGIQQDTEKATLEIVRLIMEELKRKTDGTPEEESGLVDKTSFWKRVERKIKALLVRKFVKESIICLVAKLRRKFNSYPPEEEKRLSALLEEVDLLLEYMIPPQENKETKEVTDQGCLFKKITSDNSSSQCRTIAKQLCDKIYHYLQPRKQKPQHMEEIRTEVDIFMELMSNWLKQQAEQHERKTDKVSAALRRIKRVVGNLPALSESPLEMKSDTSTSAVTEEPDVTDEPPREAAAQPDQEWDEACQLMVTMLVEKIIKDSTISLYRNDTLLIIMTLKKMLLAEIAGCDAVIKPNLDDIQQIVKAVKKNLYKMMDGPQKTFIKLQTKKMWLYEYVISSLKEHLTTPQRKTGIKQFKSLFRFRSGTKE